MEETLGQRLARLRKEHGLNQTQVGEAIGVEKSTISTYESGSRQVSIDILVALAKYYHVTIDYARSTMMRRPDSSTAIRNTNTDK